MRERKLGMAQEVLARIEAVLDQRVRPLLAMHHGSITVTGLDDAGVLSVELLGDCAGCPAADLSMRYLVRDELLEAVAELTEVVLVGGVSDDLLDQARRLMSRPRSRMPLTLIA